jgi:hypothetical protein
MDDQAHGSKKFYRAQPESAFQVPEWMVSLAERDAGMGVASLDTWFDNAEAVDFLEQLRAPPWVLVAIAPDGPITTVTVRSAESADAFVSAHGGKRNLYYSVNPTRTAMNKKPKKTDIAAVEYLLGDLDPLDDEKPGDAKARYLKQLEDFEPRATALVDRATVFRAYGG